jgi:hypothetical protein
MGALWFLLGVVCGAVAMLFIYKNNKNKLSAFAEGLEDELEKAYAKIKDLTDAKEKGDEQKEEDK